MDVAMEKSAEKVVIDHIPFVFPFGHFSHTAVYLQSCVDKTRLGRRQAARHRSLEATFVGSNPAAPALQSRTECEARPQCARHCHYYCGPDDTP
jgi:hypothetical protein